MNRIVGISEHTKLTAQGRPVYADYDLPQNVKEWHIRMGHMMHWIAETKQGRKYQEQYRPGIEITEEDIRRYHEENQ